MSSKFAKLCAFGMLVSSMCLPQAFAADKKVNSGDENIDVTQQQVTKEELAAIYVLSEVCPSLVKQDKNFDEGYARLLKDYIPNENDPAKALKSLSKQKAFKSALKEARLDAKNAGDKGNTEVCQDVSNYQSQT